MRKWIVISVFAMVGGILGNLVGGFMPELIGSVIGTAAGFIYYNKYLK